MKKSDKSESKINIGKYVLDSLLSKAFQVSTNLMEEMLLYLQLKFRAEQLKNLCKQVFHKSKCAS